MNCRTPKVWLHVLITFGVAGCSSTIPAGRIVGATYPSEEVQVFSMGQGLLPNGKKDRKYLHMRVSVRNGNEKRTLRIDPRQQVLVLRPSSVRVHAAFAECEGHAGIATLPPQGTASMDLFYPMPTNIDEAELRWAMSADDRETAHGQVQFVSLQPVGAPVTQGLWVPTAQPGQDYYVSTLHPWAEPTNDWYWWRDTDFPAWLRPRLESHENESDSAFDPPNVSVYVDDEQWDWGTVYDEGAVHEPWFGQRPHAQQQERSGWRRTSRVRQRDIHRAKPSQADDEEPQHNSENANRDDHRAEPSRQEQETPRRARETRSQESSSSASERQRPSDASSVGRSWRSHR